jgi:hypothetical protein
VNAVVVTIIDRLHMKVDFMQDKRVVSLPEPGTDGQPYGLGLPMKIDGEVLLRYLEECVNWVDEHEEVTVLARLDREKKFYEMAKKEMEMKMDKNKRTKEKWMKVQLIMKMTEEKSLKMIEKGNAKLREDTDLVLIEKKRDMRKKKVQDQEQEWEFEWGWMEM